MTSPRAPVTSRSRLLSLLSEACELEHGLLCSYLFAAFSLKQDLSEGGMSWQQQQKLRLWAAQLYAVASEEMLHLAQAWNLLAAIGGTPFIERPAFPQPATHYPLNLPLELTAFGEDTLKRFVMYELPSHLCPNEMADRLGIDCARSTDSVTVGELYALILSGFETLPEDLLFVASASTQADEHLVDFPDIVIVRNRETARQAIEMIVHQGEGSQASDQDCHFGMFTQVLAEIRSEAGTSFAPARDVVATPTTRVDADAARGTTAITHPFTAAVAGWFNDIYALMLRMLQFVFNNSTARTDCLRTFAKVAIVVMPTVLKPAGEALTLLPVAENSTRRAGPTFEISRLLPLPSDPEIAQVIVGERLAELVADGEVLGRDPLAPVPLANAVRNLRAYALGNGGSP